MKLGAEPKKLAILGGLLAVALAVVLFNGLGSGSGAPPSGSSGGGPAATTAPAAAVPPGPTATANTSTRGGSKGRTSAEFRPRVGRGRGNTEQVDPMSIDPTLKLEMLARLQNVNVSGTHRSLFDFSQPAAPKPEAPKPAVAKAKVPSPIVPIAKPVDTANVEPPKPVAPPIPMKFFGYVNPRGDPQKRAFFMEGDEIHIVREGDLVKRRYKIVRIGVNSAVVEDTNFPGSSQTLPLEEQPG
jgi:hypothetical protein